MYLQALREELERRRSPSVPSVTVDDKERSDKTAQQLQRYRE
jgi:hypothetical protein